MIEKKPHQRRFHPKTRFGCLSCKRRRVKCDERKPFCQVCESSKVKSDGYQISRAWIFESQSPRPRKDTENESSTSTIPKRGNDAGENLRGSESQIVKRNPAVYRIGHALHNVDAEASTLMNSYVGMASACRLAWEGELFRPQSKVPVVDDTGALSFSREHASSPMRHRGYLALAASAMHLFEPDTYPSQLHLKYLQMAVAEIRKYVSRHSFVIDDLLSGISKVFLATVIHGDEASARAHLSAASCLVIQKGGFNAIDPVVASVLRYADMHLAIETMSTPLFPVTFSADKWTLPEDPPGDLVLRRLSLELNRAVKTSILPPGLIEATLHFTIAAVGLSQLWISSYPRQLVAEEIGQIGPYIATSLIVVLSAWTHRSVCEHDQADFAVILVLWVQLLLCCANEDGGPISIRNNVVPILSSKSGSSAVQRYSLLVADSRRGLEAWNRLVYDARVQQGNPKPGDWLRLVSVVTEIERHESVQISPFMHRLLALRAARLALRGSILAGH